MKDIPNLAGRVALVVGGGAGAGRAVALALGRAGAAVFVSDVNPNRADDTVAEIVAGGGQAAAWPADIGNKFQVSALIERVRDEFGGLHIVVNGWWVNKRSPFLTLDEYDWRRVIEVNLTGAYQVSQLAARVMSDEGGGVIVQLGAPVDPSVTQQAPFAASQAGLVALSRVLAAELAPQGVRAVHVPVPVGNDDAVAEAVLAALR